MGPGGSFTYNRSNVSDVFFFFELWRWKGGIFSGYVGKIMRESVELQHKDNSDIAAICCSVSQPNMVKQDK